LYCQAKDVKEPPYGAPSSSFLGTGAVIAGKYRLENAIARGGMGEVWVATNLVLESKVALKVLLRSLVASPEASARLLREAQAAARINHNNIVQVFDFGYIETGEPFIVMELLRGESLGDRLERTVRLSAVSAVEIIVPTAHALATAHSKGIVHRDLKPWNIFLSVDESNLEIPKVVDFGIAKMAVQHTQRVTLEGHVLGSPEYLSPEQAVGDQDIDARADVWALSVTLYESIVGKLPFEDEIYNRLLRKIVEDDPVPTTEHAAGDAALWEIIKKGLQKKRENRWQTAAELGTALENWLEEQGVYTTGATFHRSSEIAVQGAPRVMTLSAGDIETADREPLPQRAVRPRLRNMLVAATVVVLGLAAAVWAAASRTPSSVPNTAVASSPMANVSVVATPPVTASVLASAQSTVPPAVSMSSAPPKAIASGLKTPPSPSRAPPLKTNVVPAIPTEPNF
jgi:serine/threonine-protein kinase